MGRVKRKIDGQTEGESARESERQDGRTERNS